MSFKTYDIFALNFDLKEHLNRFLFKINAFKQ
jgi:hypothetical protein